MSPWDLIVWAAAAAAALIIVGTPILVGYVIAKAARKAAGPKIVERHVPVSPPRGGSGGSR